MKKVSVPENATPKVPEKALVAAPGKARKRSSTPGAPLPRNTRARYTSETSVVAPEASVTSIVVPESSAEAASPSPRTMSSPDPMR